MNMLLAGEEWKGGAEGGTGEWNMFLAGEEWEGGAEGGATLTEVWDRNEGVELYSGNCSSMFNATC